MAITGVAQVFAGGLKLFYFFVFLNAIGTAGVYPLAFVLGVEMVGRSKREVASMALNYFYTIGEAMVGIIAWLTRDWKILQAAVSAPPLLFFIYHWFITDSPRWLIAKGREVEAQLILEKAAKVNGKTINMLNFKTPIFKDANIEIEKRSIWSTFKAVASSKIMMSRVAVLFFNWSANAFVYYGLSLSSVNLSGNKYLNFILVSLVAIPGYALAQYTMNRFGRRPSISTFMIVCGIMCLSGAFLHGIDTWVSVILYLIGKLSITASFGIIYCYTTEMLPTVNNCVTKFYKQIPTLFINLFYYITILQIIRSGGCGFLSTSARFAALLAPFVPLLVRIYLKIFIIQFLII